MAASARASSAAPGRRVPGTGAGARHAPAPAPAALHHRRAGLLAQPQSAAAQQRSGLSARAASVTDAPSTAVESGMANMSLSTWLLKQEASGAIDGEMAVVLNSIATACKQIGSLVTRASLEVRVDP